MEIVNKELEAVEPALRDAMASVRDINASHLNELRSMLRPPPLVEMTLEAVATMLGECAACLSVLLCRRRVSWHRAFWHAHTRTHTCTLLQANPSKTGRR